MAVNIKYIFYIFKPKPTRENSIMVIQKASNFMFLVQVWVLLLPKQKI